MFRAILANVIHEVLATPGVIGGKEPSLNIVLESGHKNATDAVRLYNLFKDFALPATGALSGLTFASKKDSLPLAAADLLAYGAYIVETGGKTIGRATKPLKADSSYRNNIHRIKLTRETLLGLHEQAIAIANGTLRPFSKRR